MAGNMSKQAPVGDCVDDGLEEVVFDVFARGCPSRPTMEHVTGRWGGLVLVALADGDMRFNALRRRVDGISEKMLAQALHALERDGLVVREVRQAIPPKVEYRLTEFGGGVVERLSGLIEFIEGNMAGVLDAQERYDTAKAAEADGV
ncbi:winged helix-turn-helix transcriptional regulator [Yinghuangia soli]|uniref:Helix-turn-helix transcriptional regulator n=1 Tax=Yinghuangia soli TaxID=2908204 RepID=A0AA41Q1K7_9ACTN|nr:helix-turn-helix domain-containing protein [Yinghuangia soli]MCF2529086.1 helix-turn-helix transcriptional regulator [Yinghuangia soli]